jgi:hypothetical protein
MDSDQEHNVDEMAYEAVPIDFILDFAAIITF